MSDRSYSHYYRISTDSRLVLEHFEDDDPDQEDKLKEAGFKFVSLTSGTRERIRPDASW